VIVAVTVGIYADETMTPFVLAEERRLVVQVHEDFEGNVLKGAAALEDSIDRATKEAQRQIRLYRETDARRR
jgi:hypothetical protein